MADTIRRDNPTMPCSDCGHKGTVITHWGPLAPQGSRIHCCASCWTEREVFYQGSGMPKPLLQKDAVVAAPPKSTQIPSSKGRVVASITDLPKPKSLKRRPKPE